MASIVTEEFKNTIPPEMWDEWKAVTQPFKDSIRRYEEVQERIEARKKGIKPEVEVMETYEQAIRNNTIDEFVEQLQKHFSKDHWMYVMVSEIADQMKGGTDEI